MDLKPRVLRTYGRYKKRTIVTNLWISPDKKADTQKIVFSSPEACSFSTTRQMCLTRLITEEQTSQENGRITYSKPDVPPKKQDITGSRNVLARSDAVHSYSTTTCLQNSTKGGKISTDFDTSRDLFNNSADISSNSSNEIPDKRSQKLQSDDDDVIACRFHKTFITAVKTSTPHDPGSRPTEESELEKPTRRVRPSSPTRRKLDSCSQTLNSRLERPYTSDRCEHTGDCRCRVSHAPDLSCLFHNLSSLNLNEPSPNSTEICTRHTHDNSESLTAGSTEVITPCSVVVAPLSENCLKKYSLSSASVGENTANKIIEFESFLTDSPCRSHGDGTRVITSDSRKHNGTNNQLLSFQEILTPVKRHLTGEFVTAKEKVLQQCNQVAPASFKEPVMSAMLAKCIKVGEGVYGEVFRTVNASDDTVALKVIPIEGNLEVNGEPQKSFAEILPEILISRELSALKDGVNCATVGFITVNRVFCCKGSYPSVLLNLWDKYCETKESENDRPDFYSEEQLFVVFEFADGGTDLESQTLTSVHQSVSILQQVAVSMAVAEQSLKFEHRDLHWGNILIRPTKEKTIGYTFQGEKTATLPSHSIKVGIIDFTLSRLQKDDCTLYCDLSTDDSLFTGRGDLQFDIYRKMRDENDNNWKPMNPHTNVLWLHYLVDKLLRGKNYPKARSDPKQKSLLRELRILGRHLLEYSSAMHVVRESSLLNL